MKKVTLAIVLTVALAAVAFGQIGNEIKVVEMFDVVARTTTVGTYGSQPIDTKNYLSAVFVLNSAKSSAGTGTSFATVIQESDDLAAGTKVNRSGTAVDNALDSDTANAKFAFKFTQSGARQIYKVNVWAKRHGTIASSKYVICRLETNNAGAPSGTLVHADAIDSVSATSMSTSYKFVEFTFQRPVDIANSTLYHVVLDGTYDADTAACVYIGSETVGSGGDFAISGAAWKAYSSTQSALAFVEEYNFATISGAAMDTVTESAAVFDTYALNLRGKKRWIRAKTTVAGSSASFVGAMDVILGEPKYKPAQ